VKPVEAFPRTSMKL